MPKVHILFAKSSVGHMAIKLDRFYYAPGDTVTGTVYFQCNATAVCDGLVLQFVGKEEAEWEDARTRILHDSEGNMQVETYYEHVEKNHVNFKNRVKISPDGWVCNPGE